MNFETIVKWLNNPLVTKIGAVVFLILILHMAMVLFKRSLARISDTGTRYRVHRGASTIRYVLIVLIVAALFSDSLGKLTLIIGIASAGIAFALQEVIVSLAGWLAISFGDFYKTGDRVQLGGIKGDVIDIGILRTTLMEIGEWVKGDQYSGRIVQVANSFVFKEPVLNYSGDFPFLWDEITLPIKYGTDYHLARNIIKGVVDEIVGDYTQGARRTWQRMVEKYLIENAVLDPVIMIAANDNWIEFTARYIVDFKNRRAVKDRIFTRILEEIDKTDGRVGIASMTVHIVETPKFEVKIEENPELPLEKHRSL
ncbi:MAG: mechanosensitive ion channel [Deltaproteobacteria bacterium]|nr:mechanosensitive ion channel [Deltaproteobacteria bacterium]